MVRETNECGTRLDLHPVDASAENRVQNEDVAKWSDLDKSRTPSLEGLQGPSMLVS